MIRLFCHSWKWKLEIRLDLKCHEAPFPVYNLGLSAHLHIQMPQNLTWWMKINFLVQINIDVQLVTLGKGYENQVVQQQNPLVMDKPNG